MFGADADDEGDEDGDDGEDGESRNRSMSDTFG
jgi:hypothetical protein